VFLFMHRPIWRYDDHSDWADVERALGERKRVTMFAGHHHGYHKTTRNGRDHYTLATTGGGGEPRGPAEGEFDHVTWVTVTDEGPTIANLMLDGIWTDDPVAEAKAQTDAASMEHAAK
jgi:hypothetical protein